MLNMKLLFVLAFIVSFVKAQGSISLCSDAQLKIEAQKAVQCVKDLQPSNPNQSFQDKVCSYVGAQILCTNAYFKTCISGEASVIGASNFIDKQIQDLLESTGSDIIPILRNCKQFNSFANGYMLLATGTNQCDYFDFKSSYIPQKNNCEESFISEFERNVDQTPTIQNFKTSTCDLIQQLTQVCRKKLTDACFNDESTRRLQALDYELVYTKFEEIVQGLDPSFTVQNNCPVVSGNPFSTILSARKKRSANPNDIAMTNTLHLDL